MEEQEPKKAITKIRVTSGGHVGTTKIEDADTGIPLRCVTDLRFFHKNGFWYVDMTISPVEIAIEAHVRDITVECLQCRREMVAGKASDAL